MATIKETSDKIIATLAPRFGRREAQWITRIIFENIKGFSPLDLIMRSNEEVSEFISQKIDLIIKRLLNDEPIQYIFGNARFGGHTFKVDTSTLIPRPETAELVDLITRENSEADLKVLDVGTGSGCIAISLARALKFPEIDAIDISEKALMIAGENARVMKVKVNFSCRDALRLQPEYAPKYDIIVSNPPYIAHHEQASMSRNVLQYEPWSALFVPDNDPLRFYRAIAIYAQTALNPGGRIYFEINPLYATQMCEMMQQMRFDNTRIEKDMQGRDRFLIANNISKE